MPLIWGALTAVLGNLVKAQIGFWIASALLAFGLSVVAQKFVVAPALADIQAQVGGLSADALAWFSYLWIDKCITTVVTAYASAAALSAVRLRRVA